MNPIKTLPRPAPVVPGAVETQTRVLFCQICDTWMPHSLNRSKTAYVCGCGSEIEYQINAAREGLAIDTAESKEAAKRWQEWMKGITDDSIG